MKVVTERSETRGGMPAYIARPEGAGRFPVIIFMHERYGLVQHTEDLARRCAQDGFVVCAPNFFFRHPDQAVLAAGDSRYDMTDPESVELLADALSLVEKNPAADMGKVAVAGYCQTGRHPLIYASQHPIQAAVVWYGAASPREWEINSAQPQALDKVIAGVTCPIFGAFGSDDHIISVTDIRRFRDALEQHNRSYQIHLYAGAPHGWLNDTMPGRYRKPQADAAWSAQQHFLKQVFAGEWPNEQVRWTFQCEFGRDYDFSKNRRQA
jgi:carboxymethylenebutenolidase